MHVSHHIKLFSGVQTLVVIYIALHKLCSNCLMCIVADL